MPLLPEDLFHRPIPLVPHFSPRPWGGERLKSALGKRPPPELGRVGESWELSDHPDGPSFVGGDSPAAGMRFGDLARAHPREMIGAERAPERYPILVKCIDAAERLSVQVHPSDEWCRRTGHPDRGKSECWYVLHADPGAQVQLGFRAKVNPEAVRSAIAEDRLTDLLAFFPISAGDFITIPPGTVHAMLEGTMVCEIQQSSNTTFRLFDWGREPRRELHIEQALEVANLDPECTPPIRHVGGVTRAGGDAPSRLVTLLRGEHFEVTLFDLIPGGSVGQADVAGPRGSVISVVHGSGILCGRDWEQPLKLGDTLFLPAAMRSPGLEADPQSGIRLVVTECVEG